jgi:predicted O-methyltransferase YrrM
MREFAEERVMLPGLACARTRTDAGQSAQASVPRPAGVSRGAQREPFVISFPFPVSGESGATLIDNLLSVTAMSNKTFTVSDSLYRYILSVSLREPDILRRLREETSRDPMARMQIAPEQGQFMNLLVQLMGARRALEVGVFTGYSALWVALALPVGGALVACDISEAWTSIGRRYWEEAGVRSKIDLRLAPASQTLEDLLLEGHAGTYDFAFIDADKGGYADYYERILELLRPGGLVAVDNTLWSGDVADPASQDADTRALRTFNEFLHRDERVSLSLLPIADGVTLAMKRA